MQNIGEQIKRIRLKKGLSITKLAMIAKISKGYLSSIESHKTNPSAHMIQKLAKALEVPVEQLLNVQIELLDPEWVELVTQAKDMGIDKEEVRAFLAYEAWKHSLKEEV
ncbi:helix-turn-helix domain-containing protein [Fictibacillus phosphorivorans]|uniref:helix-turn-helix domain-containing protein n=1 Tax=Fictibacillus phosphorivorans TaxID=1221500 RepID=UPI00203D3D2C|nr:helix-turn-helix domain-containing protein [Fictibacillus phosphorivorans]MCM3718505.1 helix-turn-helix domain-containing protein [Fictibacillus phosphorivorans]MCM3776139.1 helix-turn-helix domain-containing protein [Fictibacillus phosphorivorans]